jgi:hypothetical protein
MHEQANLIVALRLTQLPTNSIVSFTSTIQTWNDSRMMREMAVGKKSKTALRFNISD